MSVEPLLDPERVKALNEWFGRGEGGTAWLTGAPGSGMSTLVRSMTTRLNMEAVWVTSAAHKSRAFLRDVCRNPVAVNSKRKVLVLDELDVLLSNETAMVDVSFAIKMTSRVPVVCILKSSRASRECELRKKASLILDFPPPSREDVARVAMRVLDVEGIEVAPKDVEAVCASAPLGDLRHVLETLRFKATSTREAAMQTCDAVREVLAGCTTLDQAMRHFWGESGAVSSGVWETYHQTTDDIDVAARYSEFASCGDLVDEHIHGKHSWNLLDFYGYLTTGSAAIILPKTDVTLSKYGVSWNLEYARCTKAKQLKRVEIARTEAGHGSLGIEGVAAVRGMLHHLLGSREAMVRFCKGSGLDAATLLNVMRLWGQEHTMYKLSIHTKVKRWLAAP